VTVDPDLEGRQRQGDRATGLPDGGRRLRVRSDPGTVSPRAAAPGCPDRTATPSCRTRNSATVGTPGHILTYIYTNPGIRPNRMRVRPLRWAVRAATEHHRATIVTVLVVTAGVAAGIPQIDRSGQAGGTDQFDHLDRVQAQEYVLENYLGGAPPGAAAGGSSGGENRSPRRSVTAYVHEPEGDVLSKASLVGTLRYQQSVVEGLSSSVVSEPRPRSVAAAVGARAAGDPDATLSERVQALEDTPPAAVESLVAQTLERDPRVRRLLPPDYDGGRATDTRAVIEFRGDFGARETVSQQLYRQAQDTPMVFTVGQRAADAYYTQRFQNTVELLVSVALLLVLAGLVFAYRDLADVFVGMVGVVVSVVWMFGLLGWLGAGAGAVVVVGPVLVAGLSIDFGLHVFNRYREYRREGRAVRPSMAEGLRLVAVALALVTVTTGIGFGSNLLNPTTSVRELGLAITLGVVSSFLIFLTLVPAMKVGIDGFLEWAGFERRQRPLGHGTVLRPALSRTVTLAERAAPVVVVVALVGAALGGAAWTGLDQAEFEDRSGEVAEWKQALPGPMGWDPHPYATNRERVEQVYDTTTGAGPARAELLVRGAVTDPAALERIDRVTDRLEDDGLLRDPPTEPRDGAVVGSPLTLLGQTAAANESFAAALERADTDGDGVPDRNVAALYDRLYETRPAAAARTVERTDGEYRSLLVSYTLSVDADEATAAVPGVADATAPVDDADGLSATLSDGNSVRAAIRAALVDGLLRVTLLALVAILVAMAVAFRLAHGSATLGAVVAVPVAVVTALVVGGMYLLGYPLTLLTALLMSVVIGLGVDHAVHVGDRFADELAAGRDAVDGLRAAVTGTGGALLGSTLTSVGAFLAFVIHPDPLLTAFGTIVSLGLVLAFLTSVVLLPSLLLLWSRHGPAAVGADPETAPAED